MSEKQLHIVFGVGPVGWAVANRLAGSGIAVRAVSRRSKHESIFATATTPLATAISDTIAWYQTHRSTR